MDDCLPFRSGKRPIQLLTRIGIDGGDEIVRCLLTIGTSIDLSYRQAFETFELLGKGEMYPEVMAIEGGWNSPIACCLRYPGRR